MRRKNFLRVFLFEIIHFLHSKKFYIVNSYKKKGAKYRK